MTTTRGYATVIRLFRNLATALFGTLTTPRSSGCVSYGERPLVVVGDSISSA